MLSEAAEAMGDEDGSSLLVDGFAMNRNGRKITAGSRLVYESPLPPGIIKAPSGAHTQCGPKPSGRGKWDGSGVE